MPRHAILLLATLATLSPVGSSAAAGEPELPAVTLAPGPHLVRVIVGPAAGTHLAPDLPLVVRMSDGYFTVEERIPVPPAAGRAIVRLPLFRAARITGWTIQAEGAVCADDGGTCSPFHLDATRVRGQEPLRATLDTTSGRLRPTAPLPDPPPPIASPARKPVLIDVFATWCPPCDRMRDELLHHPDWAPFLSQFDVVAIDADHPDSFATKDQYRVTGYPTLLLTTPDGALLERIVGYPGAPEVVARLEAALDATEGDGCEGALRTVRREAANGEARRAWERLDASCPSMLAELAGDAPSLEMALELAIEVGETAQAVHIGSALATTAADLGVAAAAADRVFTLLVDSGKPEDGRALRDLAMGRIDAARALTFAREEELVALANALWVRSEWEGDKAAIRAEGAIHLARAILIRADAEPKAGQPPVDAVIGLDGLLAGHSGMVHDLVDLLESAGDVPRVGALLGAMLASHPTAFTWHDRNARWLQGQDRLPEATAAARRALEAAYGDNALRAAHRLATLLGPGDEAIAVVDAALAAPLPTEEHVRTWRYRQRLDELREVLSGPVIR